MASPFHIGVGSSANSPAAVDASWAGNDDNDGFSTRLMRLKILYSFDDENKTNCLARWPHPINAQVVCVDGSTLIGVVDLKTCIEAIITASPELVARLGKDYTVYAYDYSEYETPLVGQGMLSRALAAASPSHGEAATESSAMVTGRVCTNMLGLFANGLKETLEVKLRLVPVPTVVQDEYINNMEKYRQMNRNGVPPNVDMNAWMSFVKSNPGVSQLLGNSMSPAPHAPSPASQAHSPAPFTGLESGGMENRGPNAPSPASMGLSRTSTPVLSQPPPLQITNYSHNPSRPSSRPVSRQGSVDASNLVAPVPLRPQYQENEENQQPNDDGPVRKRAKIAKADWNGKPTFGQSAPSLRVAASEAASIRLVRPTGGVGLAGAQEAPRPPTPRVPHTNSRQSKPALSVQTSRRRESLNSASINSALPPAPPEPYDEANPTSPADRWSQPLVHSPIDIASSPPCQDALSPGLPQPSSPVLPLLPKPNNYSTHLHSDLQSDDFERPLDDDDLVLAKKPARSRSFRKGDKSAQSDNMIFQEENPGPVAQLPTKILPRTSEAQRKRIIKATSVDPHPSSDGLQPALKRLQPKPADGNIEIFSAPVLPRSDSGVSTERRQDDPPSGRSDRTVSRKRRVLVRLHDAIEKGEMPPYCENCGAIETPTWRRAFCKYVDESDPNALQKAQSEGVEKPERRRIVKKNLDEGDEGFSSVLLCNPCGLWSSKTGEFRPHTYWDKSQKVPVVPRTRLHRVKRKKTITGLEATSELNMQSEAAVGTDDEPSPPNADESNSPDKDIAFTRAEKALLDSLSRSEPVGPADDPAEQALRRALQSSPARFMGAANSPIDVDALGSTRRLLFPSPRKSGIAKSLDPSEEQAAEASASNSASPTNLPETTVYDGEATEKENAPPSGPAEDEISRLFATPVTPSKAKATSTGRDQVKTPARTVPPSPWTALLSSAQRAPVEASPFHKHLTQLMSENVYAEEDAALFSGFAGEHAFHGDGGFDFDGFTFEDGHGHTEGQLRDVDTSFLDRIDIPTTTLSEKLASAPAVMPSSPPAGQFFTVFEDPEDWGGALADIDGTSTMGNLAYSAHESGTIPIHMHMPSLTASNSASAVPTLTATSSSPDAVPKTDEVDIVPLQFPGDDDGSKLTVQKAAASAAGTAKYGLPLAPGFKETVSPHSNGSIAVVGAEE